MEWGLALLSEAFHRHRRLQQPVRSLIAALGVALSVAILVMSMFFFDGVRQMADVQFGQVQREDLAVYFDRVRPQSVRYELAKLDGVTAVALLTLVLDALGWKVGHYLPGRFDEGYGLSRNAVQNCLAKTKASLLVAVAVATGCSQGEGQTADPVATDRVVLPKSYRFDPSVIRVDAGTAVTWTNRDDFPHNVHLLDGSDVTVDLPLGGSGSLTFDAPGTIRVRQRVVRDVAQGRLGNDTQWPRPPPLLDRRIRRAELPRGRSDTAPQR